MIDIDKDDRGPDPNHPDETPRGTFGDARPDEYHDDRARPGHGPEKVEDRPLVSKVKPEDYPAEERRDGTVTR